MKTLWALPGSRRQAILITGLSPSKAEIQQQKSNEYENDAGYCHQPRSRYRFGTPGRESENGYHSH